MCPTANLPICFSTLQLLNDMPINRDYIGVKRIGELDLKPFMHHCKKKYPVNEWSRKFSELTKKWEDQISDSNWYPCKVTIAEGNEQVRKLRVF